MRALMIFLVIGFLWTPASAGEVLPVLGWEVRTHPVPGKYGMVVSRHRLASEVGAEVLARGGNAVDASVATAFALAVVLPSAGNLGGGGFMLVHLEEGRTIAIDYREEAPLAASRDMFLGPAGNVDAQKSTHSHASAGVPGTVAGLWHAHQKYGSLPWGELVEPAIRLAGDGFPVTLNLVTRLEKAKARLLRFPAGAKFFHRDGSSFIPGETFRQPHLARTLRRIAEHGPDGFYEGETAGLIVAEMARGGGLITHEDLEKYAPVEREQVRGSYRGYEVISMPPPSSGGVHIIQMLNVLENFDLEESGLGSAETTRILAETMKYAYADRTRHLGDPAFFDVPLEWLASKEYAAEIAAKVAAGGVTPSAEIAPGTAPAPEGPDTTHFSIVDRFGNAVSNTTTLNLSFGSKIVVEGAGFLLNNQMDDFTAKPGTPDYYGLIGGAANAIEPGKRPLSSMSPVIVLKDGKPAYVLGSPGGGTIITAVLQTLVNLIDFGMGVGDAVLYPRIHHQWLPDILRLDPWFNAGVRARLEAMGYETRAPLLLPAVEAIEVTESGWLFGFADLRRADGGAVGLCREEEVVAC